MGTSTVFPNYLTTATVNGKADKVGSAVTGNFAALDVNGNLTDSGHKHSDYLTQHQDISGKVDKSAASQWINSGTGSTALGIANNQDGNAASLKADNEGGNISLCKNSKYAEFDTFGMQADGSGYARIVVDDASSYKAFKLQQDGNFVDGNSVSTGGLNRDKLTSSEYAIVENTDTASKNISAGTYVVWHGTLYIASTAISSGTTLSTSDLTAVSQGGMNELISLLRDGIGVTANQAGIIPNIADLNSVPDYRAGVKFFLFNNTASNRPKSSGGAGLYIGNWGYGLQVVFSNSSSLATISMRSCSSVGGTIAFSAWKDFTVS